jgi:hypothetical protein
LQGRSIRFGSLEAWKLGSLEAWKLGSLEAWKLGSLEALYAPDAPRASSFSRDYEFARCFY